MTRRAQLDYQRLAGALAAGERPTWAGRDLWCGGVWLGEVVYCQESRRWDYLCAVPTFTHPRFGSLIRWCWLARWVMARRVRRALAEVLNHA